MKDLPILIFNESDEIVSSERTQVNKDKILKYLQNAEVFAAMPMYFHDKVTGEPIPGEAVEKTDGKYRWWSSLEYYVEKYDQELNTEFFEHIINSK